MSALCWEFFLIEAMLCGRLWDGLGFLKWVLLWLLEMDEVNVI